jgi:hypothetical protein
MLRFQWLAEAARERSGDFAVLQDGERYKCLVKRLWLAGANTISPRYTYNVNVDIEVRLGRLEIDL